MRKATLPIVAALVATPAIAQAQDTGVTDLGDIIISGGLTPIEEENYGRSVSVITAEDIERRGVRTLQDALRGVPSVAVNSTGESFTQIRIRGGEGNHVLVLIDGVEANTGSSGEYFLSGLTIDNIERIEVLRGPQSTLYGPNALSGVVSITTKRAEKSGTSYGGGVEYGSNNTRAANAYVRQKFEKGELNFSAEARHTDGEDGSRLDGGDTEFNDRETVNLTGRYEITDRFSTGFTLRKTWQHYGTEDTISFGSTATTSEGYLVESPANTNRNEVFGSLWAEGESASGRSKHRLTLSGNNQDTASRDGSFGPSSSDSTHRSYKYVGSFALSGGTLEQSAHKLNVLLEHEEQSYSASFTGGGTFERESEAVAVEYLGAFENGLDLQLGLRRDFNDTFEDATTWNASVSYWLPNQNVRLRGAMGRAFVNPTMFEQFGFVPGSFAGNPDLKPEESLSYELGADFDIGAAEVAVTVYRNEVDNLIQGSGTTSVNIDGTSKSTGFELETTFAATDWLDLHGSYAYTDAKTANGTPQVRRPRHELRLSASAEAFAGRGSVNVDLRYVADNYGREFFNGADSQPTTKLPSFVTVDVATTYDLTDTVQLTARVNNLFDEDVQEAWGYFGNGREVFVGLNAAF